MTEKGEEMWGGGGGGRGRARGRRERASNHSVSDFFSFFHFFVVVSFLLVFFGLVIVSCVSWSPTY